MAGVFYEEILLQKSHTTTPALTANIECLVPNCGISNTPWHWFTTS